MTTDTFHSIDNSIESPARERVSRLLRRIVREPLVHFLVLGAALFGLNSIIAPTIPPERLIAFTADDKKTIVDAFTTARGHAPLPEELKPLIDEWVLNEITYREALAQGFDKGDEMIRQRLMQKMSLLIFSNVNVDAPTEDQLQQWLDAHRAQYDVPKRVSFFEVPIGQSQDEAQSVLKQVNAGKEPESVRLRAHTFVDRPLDSLIGGFSQEFIDKLVALPAHKWEMLTSADGWHIVRLEAVVPARKVQIDEVRVPLTEDWKLSRARADALATVRRMGKNYVIGGLDQP